MAVVDATNHMYYLISRFTEVVKCLVISGVGLDSKTQNLQGSSYDSVSVEGNILSGSEFRLCLRTMINSDF